MCLSLHVLRPLFFCSYRCRYCGEGAAPLFDSVFPILLAGVDSDEPTLRQPCAYGVGVAAGSAPLALGTSSWVDHCLQRLAASASKPGAREGEQESATDNVVSAIGTMCVNLAAHGSVQRNGDALWQQYLGYLPLRSDVEEAAKVTLQLCRLTRAGDVGLLGAQRQRLPLVWAVLIGAVGEPGSSPAVHSEIVGAIQVLSSALAPDQIAQLWAATAPDVAAKARAHLAI